MKRYFIVFMTVMLLILPGCRARAVEELILPQKFSVTLPDEAAYLIVGSGMLSPVGDINVFDKDGKQIQHTTAKMMSLSKIARTSDDAVYLAGDRGNSNLYIHDGQIENFYLLDNPQYTGSFAASMDEQRMYAVMNGNTSEETGYECLLVARDRKTGDTIYQTIVPLLATSMLDHEGKLYIVGSNAKSDLSEAVIVIVDKQTGQIEHNERYKGYGDLRNIVLLNGEIVVGLYNEEYTIEELVKYKDGEFHHLANRYERESIEQVVADNEYAYVYSGTSITQITPDGEIVSREMPKNSEAHHISMEVEDDLVYLYTIEKTDLTTRTVRIGVYDRNGLELKNEMFFEVPCNDVLSVIRLPQR